jgi:hypothetical protein
VNQDSVVEREYAMWNFIAPAGVATASVDFTHDLSLLFVGLVSLVGVSGGMLVLEAVRHYLAERTEPSVAAGSAATAEYRKAA